MTRKKKGDTDIPKKEKVWTKTFISGRQKFNDVDTVTRDWKETLFHASSENKDKRQPDFLAKDQFMYH